MKYIHWKNSARAGELLVRKQMPEELFDTILIMDLAPADGAPVSKDTVDDQSSMEKDFSGKIIS